MKKVERGIATSVKRGEGAGGRREERVSKKIFQHGMGTHGTTHIVLFFLLRFIFFFRFLSATIIIVSTLLP